MLWKILKTLYWVVLCLFIAGSALGCLTAYGGGDARYFYALTLCGSLGVAFFSLGVWAAWDGEWHYLLVGAGLAGMMALIVVLGRFHESVYVKVRNGHTGAFVKNGEVMDQRLSPGFYWRSPFVEVREQRTDPIESIFRISARDATGDKIDISIVVRYQVPAERLAEAVLLFPNGIGDEAVWQVIEDETQRLMVRFRSADPKRDPSQMTGALENAARPRLEARCVELLRISIAGIQPS